MIKKISAALLIASMLTAPALAAGSARKVQTAPVTTSAAVDAKAQIKPGTKVTIKKVRHVKHVRHHRAHKTFVAHKRHAAKAGVIGKMKVAKPAAKHVMIKRKSA